MSHHLSQLRIQNYRSIVDLEIHLAPLTPVVGENNVGKSNILNAIQWFVKPDKLEQSHFHNISQPIVMEGTIAGVTTDIIDNLTESHAERLRPFVEGNKLKFRRTMEAPGPASRSRLELADPESGDFVSAPTGFPGTLTAMFPDPVRIEAMVDASEDAAKNKSTTTLGRLLAKLSEPVAESQSSRLEQIFGEVSSLLSAEGSNRAEQLQEFDQEASEAVQNYFPGIEVSVDFPAPTLPDLFKNGTMVVKEEGSPTRRKFEELGHGAQRSIQMALVQVLASRVRASDDSPRCTLLLIDEPELYLHPQAIEQIRLSLKKLSEAGYQVIFSTHSPLLIHRTDLPNANIITKADVLSGTKVNARVSDSVSSVLEGETVKQAQVLFELGNAIEILFCRQVLLVEGYTEPKLIPSAYNSIRERSLRADKTGIVQLSGSGDTKKALQILTTMGVQAKALVDLDYAYKQAVRSGLIAADSEHRQEVKQWFADNHEEHEIELCEEGWPKNGPSIRAEGAYCLMAQDETNSESIDALHELLKAEGIWLWRKGSIEKIIGIENKNDHQSISEKCMELEEVGSTALAEEEECRAFCDWLATS